MKMIIRDTALIWGLTAIGGFIIGFFGRLYNLDIRTFYFALSISNVILLIVGFCISASLTPKDRFSHIFYVAFAIWLVGALNIFFVGLTFFDWAMSIFLIFLTMGIGGGISYLFAPKTKNA